MKLVHVLVRPALCLEAIKLRVVTKAAAVATTLEVIEVLISLVIDGTERQAELRVGGLF